MRNFLNLASWTLLFLFAPFTILVILSQNTFPGDFFYPVKRGLEETILAAASFSPATRVAFRTDLTERRFEEAQKLLLAKSDTSALNSFISEVKSTQEEVDALSNVLQKSQATEKLIAKINDYEVKLTQIQAQSQPAPPAVSMPQSTPLPTQYIRSEPIQPQSAGSSAQPLEPEEQPAPLQKEEPSEVVFPKTPLNQEKIGTEIANAKIELQRIKKSLEEKKEDQERKREDKEDEKEGRKEKRNEMKRKNPVEDED